MNARLQIRPVVMAMLLSSVAAPAGAQALAAEAPSQATGSVAAATAIKVFHQPVIAWQAGKPLAIQARVAGDWKMASLLLVISRSGASVQEISFLRNDRGEYQAVVSGETVQAPGLDYWIVSANAAGERHEHFASAASPQRINVFGYSEEQKEIDRLGEWDAKRSTLRVRGELTRYGRRREILNREVSSTTEESDAYSDQLWTGEADYSYRPLRILYAFRFGFGVMRGERPQIDGKPIGWNGKTSRQPGLNYGTSDVTFVLLPYLAAGPKLVLGASEAGFVAGGGGRVTVGYVAGTRFEAGYEFVKDVGYRADFRFHWDTLHRFPMALGLDLSNWPYTERPQGANLSYDLGWRIVEGSVVSVRAGRANRALSTSSGYVAGLTFMQDF